MGFTTFVLKKKNHMALMLVNGNGIKYISHIMLDRFLVETLSPEKEQLYPSTCKEINKLKLYVSAVKHKKTF